MRISYLGFGGSAIGGVHNKTDDEISKQVVKRAVGKGINYIDTAPWYGNGHAERVLGEGLTGIPRHSYYVATKVGRYKPEIKEMFDFTAERTLKSVEESLLRLKLDYVDIIQVHDLEFAPNLDIIVNETLPALQKVKDSGKARFIGITGYPLETLKEVVCRSQVKIDTVLSYCRCCFFDNTLQQYINFFKDRNIGIINAAVLGMGLLSNKGPASWHPAGTELKEICAEAAEYCRDHGVDVSKLALYYSLQQLGPATHLVSVAELDLLEKNADVAINGISEYEHQILQEIINRYFSKINPLHWENVDVARYWQLAKEQS